MYNKFGPDYITPCIKYAVDTLSDEASNKEASLFFKDLASVSRTMRDKLTVTMKNECYVEVKTLQLS